MLRRQVLIFHQAALGDFIVTWPIAVALGRIFAQSRITYITPASKGKLAECVLGVESVDVENGWHLLHAADATLPEANARLLGGAHTIVSFISEAGDAWEQNVARLAPEATVIRLKTKPVAEEAVIDPQLPASLQNHITAVLVAQMAAWPMVQAGVRQILRSVAERGLPIRRVPQNNTIVIHPGAGKPEKCWPAERVMQLVERLKRREKTVRIILGEAELEKWPRDVIDAISNATEVRRPATFVDLLNEIAAGSAFVGNDSGPAHLAGIIGVPTVALFGNSPARWKPLGPRVTVIHRAGVREISVDEVEAALGSAEK